MANGIIDLKKLRNDLKQRVSPENELPSPAELPLLETAEAAHPDEYGDEDGLPGALVEWTAYDAEPSDAAGGMLLLLAGGILIIGAVVAAFFKNFLFSILLLISGGLMIAQVFRTPREMHFAVTARGIKAGSRIYEFGSIDSFWIFYDPPLIRDLSILSRKRMMPVIKIPLGDLDPLRLRETLLRFLQEKEQELSLIDVLSKRLGF